MIDEGVFFEGSCKMGSEPVVKKSPVVNEHKNVNKQQQRDKVNA